MALGAGSSLIKGFGQNAAVDAANKAAKSSARLQTAQAMAGFQLGELQNQTQYAWDRARTAQLRVVEAQNALDQANYGTTLIGNAIENYEINQGALRDQFVVQEALRGTQVALEQGYTQNKLAADTSNQVGQYMRGIRDNALQQTLLEQQQTNQVQELLGSLALDEQKDGLEWQLRKLEAIEADAATKAKTYVRQGGGNTAKRLSMQAANNLGRIYGELAIKSNARDQKLRLLSTSIKTEGASQMGRLALASQDSAQRIAYSQSRFNADSNLSLNQLEKLTMPSFDLSQRQYGRELRSLQLQTNQAFQKGTNTYRQKEYMDPIAPMKGIAPMAVMPTMQQKQSGFSMFGGAVMAGAKGALSGAQKVKNSDGTWSTQWL
jgi:hypothetical protein